MFDVPRGNDARAQYIITRGARAHYGGRSWDFKVEKACWAEPCPFREKGVSPTLQMALVSIIVVAAVAFVARAAWKTWFGRVAGGCGSGCGTCASAPEQPQQPGRYPLPQA